MLNHIAIPFKRGSTFTFLLEVPAIIEDAHFLDWTLRSQVRKREDSIEPFIAELLATWEDPLITRIVKLHFADTTEWPLGLVEVDVLFTSPEGVKVSSATLLFDVQREITQ